MSEKYDKKLNLVGFSCPLPVLKTQLALEHLQPGEVLWVIASDPQTVHDLPVLVAERQDRMCASYHEAGNYHFFIEKVTAESH